MLDANPKVARGSFGEYWLGSCYTDSLLIGIRRETGGDSGSIGLLRSLKALTSNPRMATRAWYVQQVRLGDHQGWDAWALADLDAGFNRYAAPGKSFIEPALVQQDITALEAVIRTSTPTRARPSRTATMTSGAENPRPRQSPGPNSTPLWTP